jgi:hypothetical protein
VFAAAFVPMTVHGAASQDYPVRARAHDLGAVRRIVSRYRHSHRNRQAQHGLAPSPSRSPHEFAKFFRDDFKRIEKLVQVAGVKPD